MQSKTAIYLGVIIAIMAVICIIRNTENVSPINKAANLPLSFTRSLNPIRKMPEYRFTFRLRPCSSCGISFLPDEHVDQQARIDRRGLFLKPENHRQHPQIHFLLALIRKLDFGRDIRLNANELQWYLDVRSLH